MYKIPEEWKKLGVKTFDEMTEEEIKKYNEIDTRFLTNPEDAYKEKI